jgi:hypothetical protein
MRKITTAKLAKLLGGLGVATLVAALTGMSARTTASASRQLWRCSGPVTSW